MELAAMGAGPATVRAFVGLENAGPRSGPRRGLSPSISCFHTVNGQTNCLLTPLGVLELECAR